MKIKYSPQVAANPDIQVHYEFEGEKITAKIGEAAYTYDLTSLEGQLDIFPEPGEDVLGIRSSPLPFCPIRTAYRDENGTLWVELIKLISLAEKDEEVLFPDWEEVD